jgi:transcription elongation factor Elf1
VVETCVSCGEPIKRDVSDALWIHESTGLRHCGLTGQKQDLAVPKWYDPVDALVELVEQWELNRTLVKSAPFAQQYRQAKNFLNSAAAIKVTVSQHLPQDRQYFWMNPGWVVVSDAFYKRLCEFIDDWEGAHWVEEIQ